MTHNPPIAVPEAPAPDKDATRAPAALRAFEADDLYLHKKITEIACAPDGKHAACVVRSVDRERDAYVSCIWEFALDGDGVAQLTFGPGRDAAPAWSPDGQTLAFLSDRSDGNCLYLLPRRGGEARQMPKLPGAIQRFRFTADGQSVIATTAITVDPDDHGHPAEDVPVQRAPNAPEVAWRLPYKADGVGYLLGRQVHLFRLDICTGEVVQLTRGDFDVLSFAPSPDSERVAYTRTRSGRFAHASDLWVCSAQGKHHDQVTDSYSLVMDPTWAPGGASLAFSGAVVDGDAELRPWVVELAQRRPRPICDADVAIAGSLRWVAADALVFVNAHEGRHRIVRSAAYGGVPEPMLDVGAQIGAFDLASSQAMLYAADHPSLPSELRLANADGSNPRVLSSLNGWWAERTVVKAESRRFDVPDGNGGTETIQGWVLCAEDGPIARPLLSDFHGGPASYALLDFDSSIYWQVLCSRGWRVLALNPVGSSSFGREFCRRLAGRWGSLDFPQHLAVIDKLQREGLCDTRIAVAGKSYGGYMASWAVGHTDRIRAAVVMAPVGNIETHYGTSDGGYYADPYFLATAPRFDAQKARDLSPMQYIDKSRTPTLFLQGKDDERCPKCQSEELFVRMARASDTPAEMVLYPGEGHGFLSTGAPTCRADATARIVRWLEKHVQPDVATTDP
jgi:dipeptidyl aminopeptidase/acylaminoacyl peptidase